jgi:hypothetical protein
MKNYLIILLALVCTICIIVITINTYQMGRYQLMNVDNSYIYRVIDTKTGAVKSYKMIRGGVTETYSTSHFNIE